MPYKNIKDKKENVKKWIKDNPEKRKKICRRYYEKNCEKINEYGKQWYQNNPERSKENNLNWRKNNPERVSKISRNWQKKNPEKVKEDHRKWCAKVYKTNLRYRLNSRMCNAIKKSLKISKDDKHWKAIVGYTIENLIKRLKSTMPKGYTWQDYLESKLHIDHIIPISVFNFTRLEHTDFKRCWALSNLRLLPAKDNLTKHSKLDRPFQPALKI